MIKTFPLQPLVNLAQQKNDAAAKKLGQLNQQQHTAETKLEALQQFRKDYQVKFRDAVKQGIAPENLRNFQDFINRLDEAIVQQKQAIEKVKSSVRDGRDEFKDTTRKMKSFDTLAQRHLEAEKKLEAKSEQRLQDEHTGRFAAYKAAEKNSDQ